MASTPAPWKSQLTPASFRGAVFHIEMREKASGRRDFVHEFPNRDLPYSEDLGRRARRFTIQGYIIGPSYMTDRDTLVAALEAGGPGTLQLPVDVTYGPQQVVVDHYAVVERRIKGGYCEFEMTFTEAGAVVTVANNTQSAVTSATDAAQTQTAASLDDGLANGAGPGQTVLPWPVQGTAASPVTTIPIAGAGT